MKKEFNFMDAVQTSKNEIVTVAKKQFLSSLVKKGVLVQGHRYQINGLVYILARVDDNTFNFISLQDGNRYSTPVKSYKEYSEVMNSEEGLTVYIYIPGLARLVDFVM